MSIWLLLVVAAATYASRAAAVVAMPDPSARVRRILDRVPAPLFAAFAALTLFDAGDTDSTRTLAAAVGALILAPSRSLLLVLLGGLVGYVVVLVV